MMFPKSTHGSNRSGWVRPVGRGLGSWARAHAWVAQGNTKPLWIPPRQKQNSRRPGTRISHICPIPVLETNRQTRSISVATGSRTESSTRLPAPHPGADGFQPGLLGAQLVAGARQGSWAWKGERATHLSDNRPFCPGTPM